MSILESMQRPADEARPVGRLSEITDKAWAFGRLLLRPRLARKLGTLATRGYLAETGWVRSVRRRDGLDAANPEPWATYPFVRFITPRLRPDLRVFEYGAGTSTLFYASRVRQVVAVEHDPGFHRVLAPLLPRNAQVRLLPERSDDYVHAIDAVAPFDLVVVDGRDRVRCARAARAALTERGVVVLDDAERGEYAPALTDLEAAGYRRLDFHGLAAGIVHEKNTAVFYRAGNCLGI